MLLTMMKAKLHRATVTQCDLHYEGSISIDKDLLAASGILPNEQVDVLNITNGERLTTYAIEAPAGSGMIGLNGAGIVFTAGGAQKYWLLAVLVVAITTTFLVELVIPYDTAWNRDRADSTRDRIHVAVNETLILASVATIPLLAAIVPAPPLWPHSWPFIAQVLAAILVADLGITVVHLASHKIGVLWRFHAVHHSITRFYGLNGQMKHPLHQTVEMAAGVAPLILIGLPVDVASVLALAVAIQLLLQHSNADYRIGPAKYVLALNEGHRFHHLKWAGVGDVNFGLFTLVWDHLMRTPPGNSTPPSSAWPPNPTTPPAICGR